MEFIESSGFSSVRENYLDDQQLNLLQLYLIDSPDAGKIVKGSGGVRKLRWGYGGQGKRGGLRIVYYWSVEKRQILLLTVYRKNEATDISKEAIKTMRKIVKSLS